VIFITGSFPDVLLKEATSLLSISYKKINVPGDDFHGEKWNIVRTGRKCRAERFRQ
jgi:hypothetical protein